MAKQAKTVAVGCERLPRKCHGKEDVSGSSPSEGFTKAPCTPSRIRTRATEVLVQDAGPSLLWATAEVMRRASEREPEPAAR
jgi:hypothetical protein